MLNNANDLKLLCSVYNSKRSETKRFARMYLYTTENIAGYLSESARSETALTVTSSGDHIINLLYLGTKVINAFDINPLAKYIAELKVAALNLTYEEFMSFFFDKQRFNRQLYDKIKLKLSKQVSDFWDYAYELSNYDPKALLNSNIFNAVIDSESTIKASNLYTNKAIYNRIAMQAKSVHITYTTCSITDIPELFKGKVYDQILFSNISDYLINIYGKERYLENYKQLMDSVAAMLKIDGYFFFAYIYDIGVLECRTDIDNLAKVEQVMDDFSVLKIKSVLSPVKKDVVLIKRGGHKDGK